MRGKDPLESWLYLDRALRYDEMPAEFYEHSRAALGRLSALLDAPISKKVNLAESGIYECSRNALAPSDLSRACELCRRVVTRGGSSSTFVQEGLLEIIASAKDLASIPFWLEILDISRPRDSFAEKRRIYALAALARIAIRHNAPEGYEPLRTAARHQNPEVRALAVHYLGRACLKDKDSLPPKVQAELTEIAMRDPAFGPRFQARCVLQTADGPAPLDNPGGIFLFKLVWEAGTAIEP